ncbi:phage GP46 family protein [Achromobacter mucicolens]|uniref:phage GP46 family protein n=1 Tax=Achromobacter mucicolens TaxID=1389922 RepID=UPI00244B5D07|nr:phage GP46 family protein [Achromobacter mucicolens]MDH0092744.1 phage GP46 family protein [Achromobacter mucicolens]
MSTSLGRAVVISLFTWRRALDSDPVDDSDLQGWWGDSFPKTTDDRIGSRLWLLRRRALTEQTRLDAIAYAREALQWMIDDAILIGVEIEAERQGRERLAMRVVGLHADGSNELIADFNDIWQVIANAF